MWIVSKIGNKSVESPRYETIGFAKLKGMVMVQTERRNGHDFTTFEIKNTETGKTRKYYKTSNGYAVDYRK